MELKWILMKVKAKLLENKKVIFKEEDLKNNVDSRFVKEYIHQISEIMENEQFGLSA